MSLCPCCEEGRRNRTLRRRKKVIVVKRPPPVAPHPQPKPQPKNNKHKSLSVTWNPTITFSNPVPTTTRPRSPPPPYGSIEQNSRKPFRPRTPQPEKVTGGDLLDSCQKCIDSWEQLSRDCSLLVLPLSFCCCVMSILFQ